MGGRGVKVIIGVLGCAAVVAGAFWPAAARAGTGTAAPADRGGWRWPLDRPRVLRGFDPPASPWGAGHRGIDLAAPPGRHVRAAGPGRIGYAGRLAGRGVVTVVHGPLRTTYVPVRPAVRRGQRVGAGARIGVVEDSGPHCGMAGCLHWGLLRGERYLDPRSLLTGGRVRLLPVWGVPGGPGGGRADPGRTRAGEGPAPHNPPGRWPPQPASAAPARPAPAVSGRPERQAPPGTAAVPVMVTGAAAGGATMVLLLVVAARTARVVVRSVRRRRLPLDVVDFVRERERRRGGRPG